PHRTALHPSPPRRSSDLTQPFMPEELLARVNAHVGLKQTRDRLERVAHERQELVNLVAHDLKNPLTSVLFASDILLNNGTRPERDRKSTRLNSSHVKNSY